MIYIPAADLVTFNGMYSRQEGPVSVSSTRLEGPVSVPLSQVK